jgi:hypothetical protein
MLEIQGRHAQRQMAAYPRKLRCSADGWQAPFKSDRQVTDGAGGVSAEAPPIEVCRNLNRARELTP